MTEERDDTVVLIDEEGQEVEFEHLDTVSLNDNEYVILLPLSQNIQEDEEEDVDEVVILKIEHGDQGEDSFVSVDDDSELQMVFDEFKVRMEKEYEFEM